MLLILLLLLLSLLFLIIKISNMCGVLWLFFLISHYIMIIALEFCFLKCKFISFFLSFFFLLIALIITQNRIISHNKPTPHEYTWAVFSYFSLVNPNSERNSFDLVYFCVCCNWMLCVKITSNSKSILAKQTKKKQPIRSFLAMWDFCHIASVH